MPAGRPHAKPPPASFEPRGTKFSNSDTRILGTQVPGTQVPDTAVRPYSKFSQADHGSITRSDHVEKTVPRFVTDEEDGSDRVNGELTNSRESSPSRGPIKGFLSMGDPKQFLIAGSIVIARVPRASSINCLCSS